MKIAFVCSPLRPTNGDPNLVNEELSPNLERVENTCRWLCQNRNMTLTPDLYFARFLDDNYPQERALRITPGMKWLEQADELWRMGNRISKRIQAEIELGNHVISNR